MKIDKIYTSSSTASESMISSKTNTEESFQDVLVLNQAALKAMTIDAMVDESATGSVHPDAVNATAIMRFRSTLASNIIAPIPPEDVVSEVPSASDYISNKVTITTPVTDNIDRSDALKSSDVLTKTEVTTNSTTQNMAEDLGQLDADALADAMEEALGADTPDAVDVLANKIAEILASRMENSNSNTVTNTVTNTATAYAPMIDTPALNLNASAAPVTDAASTMVQGVYNAGNLYCNNELNRYFAEAAQTYHIDVKFLKAVAKTESNFNPSATSVAGAMGVMQLMPSAAAQYGADDPYNAKQNIMAGAKILSTFLERYDGDMALTLAAYNSGPGNVEKHGGVPEFTRNYINRVIKFYNE